MRIILLVGPIGAGKTTFAKLYAEEVPKARILSTSALIAQADELFGLPKPKNRTEQQKVGDELDETTDGAWIRDSIETVLKVTGSGATVIVDCVRRHNQIERTREEWGQAVIVIGIRTTVLQEHLEQRERDVKGMQELVAALQHPTERSLPMDQADIIIDNTRHHTIDVLKKLRTRSP